MSDVSYCKIFPPIGVARVGDSVDEWFFGPEPGDTAHTRPGFSHRDSEGRIKRQAVRFRIYAFDKDGKPMRELTAAEADITWTVALANKKAAWFEFRGTDKAFSAYRGESNVPPPRNLGVGHLRLHEEEGRKKYVPDEERVRQLEIDGGLREICGVSKLSQEENGYQYRFTGFFKSMTEVELGEIRTDGEGRLIVLGGHGKSDAIDKDGKSVREFRWIRNYANNDDWYDDTSDGPVRARVVFHGETKPVEVKGGAWVIVAPPDFAPDVTNIVTLYDVMEEVAYNNPALVRPDTPQPRGADNLSFETDIEPILQRMHNYRWVNAMGLRGHGFGKPGDFQKAGKLGELLPELSDKDSPQGKLSRQRILSVLRGPAYQRGPNQDATYNDPGAIEQATTVYMPPLAGDEGDPTPGDPSTWLSLTHLQYARMQGWLKGDFKKSPIHDNERLKGAPHPFALTKTVLDTCAGGAFYPGIEMTCIVRDASLYSEAFRLDQEQLTAGDITKFMALPWQADFWECQTHWWPAQRPDDVVTEEDFEKLLNQFKEEVSGDFKQQFDRVLFNRVRWDRGIGRKSRPTVKYLQSRVLPKPEPGETAAQYVQLLCGNSSDKSRQAKIDPLPALFFKLTGAQDYLNEQTMPPAHRLPNPWRLQYTAQEALDAYSGIYFHLRAPAPEEVFNKREHFEEAASDLVGLRACWKALILDKPKRAMKVVQRYAKAIQTAVLEQIQGILQDHPVSGKSAQELRAALTDANVADLEREHPEDFSTEKPIYKELRAVEMIEHAIDRLYLTATNWAGDMDMVEEWRNSGFVVERKVQVPGADNEVETIICQVETDRGKYDGRSFRDYFYYLMNIQEYPDFEPFAKQIALDVLASAEELIELKGIFDSSHPESFIEYSRESFAAKLEEIYEILRKQASMAVGWRIGRTREERIRRIVDNAPFNQTDGAWLRYVENAGPSEKVRSLLFEVWSDEVGNGNPALHHGNLYTTLLRTLGAELPPVASREYADNPDIHESRFISAVFQLAISLHSEYFLPEILGMTLYLEWEVLSLVPGVKGLDYLGIDSEFWRMHVGIDNASEGHGAKAREAVELYLDEVLKKSGETAMQDEWKRIWRGFVGFAIAGYGYYGSTDGVELGIDDVTLSRKHPVTPQDDIQALMQVKEHYGSLNHLSKRLGAHRMNDLFAKPEIFVEELAHSPWIVPGSPDDSQFLTYLTTFSGKMYKVFTAEQLAMWRKWIQWLGCEGDTQASKRYLTKAQAMLVLLSELRTLAQATDGHRRYSLAVKTSKEQKRVLIAQLFAEGDLKELMRALRDPDNGWVVRSDPGASPLVVDQARGDRAMGRMLDRRYKSIANRIGREVIIRWIEAGCPIPDEEPPAIGTLRIGMKWEGKRLLVQQLGMGAVH